MAGPIITSSPTMRIVSRTQSIEEANLIADSYEKQGFDTQIIKKQQGHLAIYEVYAGKKPDIITGIKTKRFE